MCAVEGRSWLEKEQNFYNLFFDFSNMYSWPQSATSLVLYVEIKCQIDATEVFIADLIACSTCFGHHYAHHQELKVFIADLIACSTCFGHHYAHHQELKIIIQWLLPVVFRAVVFKLHEIPQAATTV